MRRVPSETPTVVDMGMVVSRAASAGKVVATWAAVVMAATMLAMGVAEAAVRAAVERVLRGAASLSSRLRQTRR
jgi:hypothetical protein